MIRVIVSYRSPEGVSEGWLTDLAAVPQIGAEIVLRTHEGEPLQHGRVTNVRHLVFGNPAGYRAGAEQIEVDVVAANSHGEPDA